MKLKSLLPPGFNEIDFFIFFYKIQCEIYSALIDPRFLFGFNPNFIFKIIFDNDCI